MTQRSLQENGAAEMVGVLMLIAILVTVIAIIAVVLFSQPAPEKLPAVAMKITNESRLIQLSHNGGNTILLTDMAIRVDDQLVPGTSWVCPGCNDGDWSIGDTITIDCTVSGNCPNQNPNKVDIIYKKAGKDYQILTTQYLWTIIPTLTPGTSSPTSSPTPTATVTTPPEPVAGFTGSPTSGTRPLSVHFTDTSSNTPTSWIWDFGDGNTTNNNLQNPEHTYTAVGTYSVTLTATNAGGSNPVTRSNYIVVTQSFDDFVVDEHVFVYGTKFYFQGGDVIGPDATIVITGPLSTDDLNGGSSLAVRTIYIDGDVTLNGGSAGLGSPTNPGDIYVNGNLNLGSGNRDIYGTVHVAHNLYLKDANIHGIVYVNGDLTLDWTPDLDSAARIYYTGTFNHPPSMSTTILSKCIKQTTVPAFSMPSLPIPSANPDTWYAAHGYVSGGALTSSKKIFADSYTAPASSSSVSNNVIIVAKNGDIDLTSAFGGGGITGVLFAPNGRVTFKGGYFQGVVIARDGFYVTSGGTDVTFRNLDVYISDPADYPF